MAFRVFTLIVRRFRSKGAGVYLLATILGPFFGAGVVGMVRIRGCRYFLGWRLGILRAFDFVVFTVIGLVL